MATFSFFTQKGEAHEIIQKKDNSFIPNMQINSGTPCRQVGKKVWCRPPNQNV